MDSHPNLSLPHRSPTNPFPQNSTYDPVFADAFTAAILSNQTSHAPTNSLDQHPFSPQTYPIPLSHPSRIYPSYHPLIPLTHPTGSLLGGPPGHSSSNLRAYATDLVELHDLNSKQEVAEWVRHEMGKRGEELRGKCRQWREAKERNEKTKDAVDRLVEEREMERRTEERWRREMEGRRR